MRIFVSSLISGFEEERAAARSAIATLRHEPVMAEDFNAQPNSPQIACLQGLRTADLVVLILGDRYGQPQASGLSATHEEYREAKGGKPILAFVQEGKTPEPAQQEFIREVQDWEGGFFRQSFTDAENLRTLLTRALHDYELTSVQAPVDIDELKSVAENRLPNQSRNYQSGRGATVCMSIVGGPRQQIIRAAAIEERDFADKLQQAAQFGSIRLFETSLGTERLIEGDALVLRQEDGASISIDEAANMLLLSPLNRRDSRGRYNYAEASVLVEEDVAAALRGELEFASQVLEDVDPSQRLNHLAAAVTIIGAEYRGWRTRAEHDASPNSIEIGLSSSREHGAIIIDIPRPALRLNRLRMVEDITVRLRRQWRAR
jgi:hypothetical protein